MKHELEPVAIPRHVRDFVGRVDQALPQIAIQAAGTRRLPSEQIRVRVVDQHQQLGAQCGKHAPRRVQVFLQIGPRRNIFQMPHHESSRQLQPALVQFAAQLFRIRRQISDWSQLGPLVTGRAHFIQVALPRRLLRIAGKPHAPRVGSSADFYVHGAYLLGSAGHSVSASGHRGVICRRFSGDRGQNPFAIASTVSTEYRQKQS